ncbi:hypothetical protein [Streptomyces sp. NBC_00083]|uniref:hypothetical protein n=1 Tax=Streptomyces sp. NBC_00083 TaxID=2975647 RepID=UPI0022524CBA|nr:hypothetical protein [Streptomyces sp. NBC_00083]MCX5386282.1 hypothetical protein [Streptomyces sp. NBC_00083]
MNVRTDTLERLAPLWEAPDAPTRWVIWHRATGGSVGSFESVVFDRELNIPFDIADIADASGAGDVDDVVLGEVIRRMREAGAPETDAYPGRPCG